jgi:histidinol-phosphate aminotransferase
MNEANQATGPAVPDPRPGLRQAEPYASPQRPVPVRLNTNECPYPLPPGFLDDLDRRLQAANLNRYPDWEATALRTALAERAGWPVDGLVVANGSNELIQQLLLAHGGPGRRAVVFEPTYPIYSRVAWVTHTEVVPVEVEAPFAITPAHVEEAAAARPNVVFVCSPNNPTANAQGPEVVEHLAGLGALVVVDEAYIEFGGKSAAAIARTHPNVVVLRTFSKAFALAGARLGYGLVDPQVAEDIKRVRLPYHVSALTQAAGQAALTQADEAMEILDTLRRQRDRLFDALSSLNGVDPFPSDANFVLFRSELPPADVWYALLDRGVLVRDLSMVVPGCLRVSAGTPEEVDAFLAALEDVLATARPTGHGDPARGESW